MSSRPQHKKPVKGEYLETDTGNLISRRAKILGLTHIILHGRVAIQHNACLRGDLVSPSPSTSNQSKPATAITIGRYSYISSGAILHPPHLVSRTTNSSSNETTTSFLPLTLGTNVFIGENAYIAAASIGNNVYIGAGAVVGNACVIADRVVVVEGSVMVPGMAVPSGVVVGGRPAKVLGEVPPGWGMICGGVGEGEWVEGGELRELVKGVLGGRGGGG